MPPEATAAMLAWCSRGDAAAETAAARDSRRMLDAFRHQIATECAFDLDTERAGGDTFAVVFTSGAAESNCHILTGAVRAYLAKTRRLPHVITSAAEHRSLLACGHRLEHERLCQLTVLPVVQAGPGLGAVDPVAVVAALRPNTCLVSIIAASPDTGALSDLLAMARAVQRAGVAFHSDASQLFGRMAVRPVALGLDAFSVDFDKLGGPPGVGALVIRRAVVEGYGLGALVPADAGVAGESGTRGGSANLPGLGASFAAMRLVLTGRAEKNARVLRLREALKSAVAARVPCLYLDDIPADRPPSIDGFSSPPPALHDGTSDGRRTLAEVEPTGAPVVVWVAPRPVDGSARGLPNTLLLAVLRRPVLHGAVARAALEARGVVVARIPHDSPIVAALGLPVALRPCLLRISLPDATTAVDVATCAAHLLAVISTAA